MIVLISVFAYMELFSLGVAIALFKCGHGKKSFLALIPFVGFFMTKDLVGGRFKVAGIIVDNFGKTVIILAVVTLLAFLYMCWGKGHLSEKNIGPLSQLMYIPMGICGLIFWACCISMTSKYLFKIRSNFMLDKLVCALVITMPFMLMFSKVNRLPEVDIE